MFSSDAADRIFPPTERRRRDAKSRGDVARSPELTASICLLAASMAFYSLAPGWILQLASFVKRMISSPGSLHDSGPNIPALSDQVSGIFVAIVLPVATLALICALLGNAVQTGLLWNPERAAPCFRFRLTLSGEPLGNAISRLLRIAVLSSVAWFFWKQRILKILALGERDAGEILVAAAQLMGELSIQFSVCLVVLALVDLSFRRWKYEQRLKMTVEELRREQKQDEIDPAIKRRRMSVKSRTNVPADAVEAIRSLGN
jgi:flagellar biosynthetic protein FlhB